MITLYWALEYSKVFLGYLFIMFVWPSVVFRRYLGGKSKTFRFSFCVTVQVVLVNTVVLLLGLLHILNPWVIRLIFYGTFLLSAARSIRFGERERKNFKRIVTGTYGHKLFLLNTCKALKRGVCRVWEVLNRAMQSHWWEYGLLGIILLYGMIYFTYGAFQDYSYGFGDMYPHSAWIYGLTQGQIFSADVYPEAMHCFVYCLHMLFGISIYSGMLFLAGVHSLIFLLSAYILMREIFRFRYTPMFVLTAFLTVDLVCINEIYSMSRLQWSLPQEFGLYTLFLCGAFLVRYSRSSQRIPRDLLRPSTYLQKLTEGYRRKKLPESLRDIEVEPLPVQYTKGYWDENLLVFMLALAASLTIHFYPTIMAFFLCLAFVPAILHRVLDRKRFVPLVAAAILGVMIAVLPMMGALASGIPFQGSIGWAVNVINGTDGESGNTVDTENTQTKVVGGVTMTVKQDKKDTGETGSTAQSPAPVTQQDTTPQETVQQEIPKEPLLSGIKQFVEEKAEAVYKKGYVTLYRKERAEWIVRFTALALLLWAVSKVVLVLLKLVCKLQKKEQADKIDLGCFDGYLSITLASVIFMMMYCASSLGLPSLIAGSRLCSTEQMLILAMMAVPVDLVFSLLHVRMSSRSMAFLSAAGVAFIYLGTILTGTFHGYLYYELTRYNAAVMTTQSIIDTLPRYSYTIVSTTDEIYQVIEDGRHEELANFANESQRKSYTLPTEYVFIYIEKKPIQYAQSHFFEGPDWLAREKYTKYYSSYVSQCPDITASKISSRLSEEGPKWFSNSSKSYSNLTMRTYVESRVNEWVKEFDRLYPNELHIYYEDDDFVCYYFCQNPSKLYELSIW